MGREGGPNMCLEKTSKPFHQCLCIPTLHLHLRMFIISWYPGPSHVPLETRDASLQTVFCMRIQASPTILMSWYGKVKCVHQAWVPAYLHSEKWLLVLQKLIWQVAVALGYRCYFLFIKGTTISFISRLNYYSSWLCAYSWHDRRARYCGILPV